MNEPIASSAPTNIMGQPATLGFSQLANWLEHVANSWELSPYERGIALMLALQLVGYGTPAQGVFSGAPDEADRIAAVDRLCQLGLVDPHGFPQAIES